MENINLQFWFYILGSIAFVITISVFVFGLIAWFSTLRKKVKDLDGFGEWKGSVETDRAAFAKFMSEFRQEMREEIAALRKRIDDMLLRRIRPDPLTSSSPLHLNELGEAISEEIGGREFANVLAPGLLEQFRPFSAYEIQEQCFDYVKNQYALPDELAGNVLNSAYRHGLGREQVLDVLAVELRDRLLVLLDRTDDLPP